MHLGYYLSLGLIFLSSLVWSQTNFISNGSFEDKSSCPNSLGDIEDSYWRKPINHIGSSDYFHGCTGLSVCDVPTNFFGTANAADGIAYAGIYLHDPGTTTYHEYIMDTLTQTLVAGRPYVVSFEYRLAPNCNRAAWDLGFWLTASHPTKTSSPYNGTMTTNPTSRNTAFNYLDNYQNWETYIDTIVATGGEQYITIGSFDAITAGISITNSGATIGAGYYYIDDVQMHEYPGVYGDSIICTDSVAQIHASFLESVYWVDSANSSTIISYNDTIWVSPTSNTTYWCIGATSGDTFSFDVDVVTPPQNFLIDDTVICANEQIELVVSLTGWNNLWSTGLTGDSLVTSDTGFHWLQLSAGSCQSTESFHLDHHPFPEVNLGNDTTICNYDSVPVQTGLTGYGHLWSTGDTTSSVMLSDSGTVTLEVYDANCSFYDTLLVEFFIPITVDLGNDEVACFLSDTTVSSSAVNAQGFQWSTGQTTQQITVTTSGTYYITVSNPDCIATDSVTILFHDEPDFQLGNDTSICAFDDLVINPQISPGSYSYLWNDGTVGSNYNLTVPNDGILWVEISDSLCTLRDSIEVIRRSAFQPMLTDSFRICEGDTSMIVAQSSDTLTYDWNTGSDSPAIYAVNTGFYVVSVSDDKCEEVDSARVDVIEYPILELGNDTILCDIDPFLLVPDVNLAGVSYLWSDGSGGSQLQLSSDQSALVWLEVTNEMCSVTDSIFIERSLPPEVILPGELEICSDEPAVVEAKGDSTWTYTWSNGTNGPVITISESGRYGLETFDGKCYQIDSLIVDIYRLPLIEILGPEYICLGEEVNLEATGDGYDRVRWSTGSVDSIVTVIEAGIYYVNAEYACGKVSDSIEIEDCECVVWIPNAFVPGSNSNPTFGAKFHCDIVEFDLTIYDRWGHEIFRTSDPLDWWDGTDKGNPVTQGVYTWQLVFDADYKGKELTEYRYGTVTLLR